MIQQYYIIILYLHYMSLLYIIYIFVFGTLFIFMCQKTDSSYTPSGSPPARTNPPTLEWVQVFMWMRGWDRSGCSTSISSLSLRGRAAKTASRGKLFWLLVEAIYRTFCKLFLSIQNATWPFSIKPSSRGPLIRCSCMSSPTTITHCSCMSPQQPYPIEPQLTNHLHVFDVACPAVSFF